MATSRRRSMSDGVNPERRTAGMGLLWTLAAAGGPAALPGDEKKVEQVFNLFAQEMPMERRRVVGFEGVLDGDDCPNRMTTPESHTRFDRCKWSSLGSPSADNPLRTRRSALRPPSLHHSITPPPRVVAAPCFTVFLMLLSRLTG